MARRAVLAALCVVAVAACTLMLLARPAGADYSDHGTPDVSAVTGSTHPQTYPGGGEDLARTGVDLDRVVLGAVVLVAGGIAVVLASSKRRYRHG